ncbi:unnamed protein product [Rhodiola kirilowii]
MAPGAFDVENLLGERKLKRKKRVNKYSVARPCSKAIRSAEDNDFSHLFRANEEWNDASGDNGWQDDNLVNRDGEIDPNEVDSGFTRPDSYLVINLSALRSKKKRGKWSRRLTEELEQVRGMVKQLEGQGTRSTSYFSMNEHDHMGVADRDENTMQDYSEVASVREQDEFSVTVSGRVGHKSAKNLKKVTKTNKEKDACVSKKKVAPSRSVGKSASEVGQPDNFVKQAFKSCKSLLTQLMKHKFAWVFNVPVDAEGFNLYDYHSIIKHPMDLGTVKDRLTTNWYESPVEFAEDVRLTFRNAMTYNPKGHDVHVMAEQLLEIFEQKWLAIEEKYNRDMKLNVLSDKDLVAPTSERISHPSTPFMRTMEALESSYSESPANSASPGQEMVQEMPVAQRTSPSIGTSDGFEFNPSETPITSASPDQEVILEMLEAHRATPSTKTMDAVESNSDEIPGESGNPQQEVAIEMPEVHKDMSYEEKLKLNASIQDLPPLKLGGVVDIIKKRNSALFQNEEEVELDINFLDAETLWELDSYVLECNSDLGTTERKAEKSYQTSAGLDPAPVERGVSKVPPIFEEQFSPRIPRQSDYGSKSSNSGNYLYSSSRDLDRFRRYY